MYVDRDRHWGEVMCDISHAKAGTQTSLLRHIEILYISMYMYRSRQPCRDRGVALCSVQRQTHMEIHLDTYISAQPCGKQGIESSVNWTE
jgi:hypothetical protein